MILFLYNYNKVHDLEENFFYLCKSVAYCNILLGVWVACSWRIIWKQNPSNIIQRNYVSAMIWNNENNYTWMISIIYFVKKTWNYNVTFLKMLYQLRLLYRKFSLVNSMAYICHNTLGSQFVSVHPVDYNYNQSTNCRSRSERLIEFF